MQCGITSKTIGYKMGNSKMKLNIKKSEVKRNESSKPVDIPEIAADSQIATIPKKKPSTGIKLKIGTANSNPIPEQIDDKPLIDDREKIKINESVEIALPNKEILPNMHAVKKPLHSGNSSKKLQIKVASSAKTKSAPAKRDVLYGTGLTKSLLGSAEKQHEKSQTQTTSLQDLLKKKTQSQISTSQQEPISTIGQTSFEIGHLPSQLIPDDLVLDEYQTEAVNGLANEMYGVLIGAAGTGKTTALKFIIKGIENQVAKVNAKDLHTANDSSEAESLPAIAFCSFTGKAVQQMKRALPEKYHPLANTIHATLGFAPVVEEYFDKEADEWKERRVFRPTFTAENKLPFKIIIVDESGTVPLNLWHQLLAATVDDCRIFLIGDLNQLPPVSGHSILGFAMLKWPTFALEKLHRQAEGDPIAENAHRILASKKPLTDKVTNKFIVKEIPDGSKGAKQTILQVIRHLNLQGEFDPLQDALIVPQNKGNLGQPILNQILVQYFNPLQFDDDNEPLNPRTIITAGYVHMVFAVGDKVMLLANDNARGLTNGMVGIVTELANNANYSGDVAATQATLDETEIDLSDLESEISDLQNTEEAEDESERAASHVMTVEFQNVKQTITFETAGAFKKVALAYAMTCHKAQGSEYRNVVVVAHASNLRMMTREWLYTAITRAKEKVILLCNHRGLTHAVNNQRIKGDTIADKAKKFLALQTNERGESPAKLPEPRKLTTLKPEFK